MSPTLFKADVMAAVRAIDRPFTFAEVASRLGEGFGPGEAGERRLRRALDGLKNAGALVSIERGVMAYTGGVAIAGVTMAQAIDTFLRENGGLMRAVEFRRAHGMDDSLRIALHRLLDEGREVDRYEWLPVMHDGHRWWGLPEAERLALPVPGWRIWPDLALDQCRNGGSPSLDLARVNARRRAIGLAIQDARDALNLEVDDCLALVGEALFADIANGRASVLAKNIVTLADYWRDAIAEEGQDGQRRAWLELEEVTDFGDPWPGSAITASTWLKIGEAFGVDAAKLSRGGGRWSFVEPAVEWFEA